MKRNGQRLDAFLAHAGIGSRSEVRRLIRSWRIVTVDGETCTDPARHVSTETVAVDGTVVAAAPTDVVLLMHKPVGHACSHDVAESPVVFELLDDAYIGTPLQCVGRLDRESSGLLVLTDDGQLNHALTHPKRKVPRRYRLVYEGDLVPDAVERVAEGIVLRDDERPTKPARLVLGDVVSAVGDAEGDGGDVTPEAANVTPEAANVKPEAANVTPQAANVAPATDDVGGDDHAAASGGGRVRRGATIVLSEGRYHQIRRMIAALGGRVISLHRDRIGMLELPDDLSPGAVRPASAEEIERLRTPPAVDDPTTT